MQSLHDTTIVKQLLQRNTVDLLAIQPVLIKHLDMDIAIVEIWYKGLVCVTWIELPMTELEYLGKNDSTHSNHALIFNFNVFLRTFPDINTFFSFLSHMHSVTIF